MKQHLLALLLGFSAAVFGTVIHQSTTPPEIPLGLIFALAIALMAAAEVRSLTAKKLPGVTFTAALAITIFLAAQDFTGDKLIPLNQTGLIWSYGAIGIAILVSAFPRIENR